MTRREKFWSQQIIKEVLDGFPDATIESCSPAVGGGVLIVVKTKTDDEEERLSDWMAARTLDILVDENVNVMVAAICDANGAARAEDASLSTSSRLKSPS